jgi:hypothetical protein
MPNSVAVTGGTQRQKNLAIQVAYFCIGELMPRVRTLDIKINLTKMFEKGSFAECWPRGDCLGSMRTFEIDIDHRIYKPFSKNPAFSAEKGYKTFIQTICHEMVHIMQWVRGLLTERVYPRKLGYRKLWKGKTYKDVSYSKQPWERQAHAMESKLFKKFEANKQV